MRLVSFVHYTRAVVLNFLPTMASTEKADVIAMTHGDAPGSDTSSSPASGIGDKHHTSPPRHDLDQAYWYMQHTENATEASPQELSRLRRKIDWWIVPIMFCCYTMQFIDKVSLNVCIHSPLLRNRIVD